MASGTFFSSSHGGKELRPAKQAYLCIKTPHMMVVEAAAAAVCSPHTPAGHFLVGVGLICIMVCRDESVSCGGGFVVYWKTVGL